MARCSLLLTSGRDARDRVRQIVGNEQRSAAIDRHADGPAKRLAVLTDKAVNEIDRRTGWLAAAEGHEDDLVTGR